MLTNRLDLSPAPCKVSPLCTSFLKLNFDFVTIHNVLLFILSKWPSFDQYPKKKRRWGPRSLLIGYNINPMKIFQGSPSHIHFDPLQSSLSKLWEREKSPRDPSSLKSGPDKWFSVTDEPFLLPIPGQREQFQSERKDFWDVYLTCLIAWRYWSNSFCSILYQNTFFLQIPYVAEDPKDLFESSQPPNFLRFKTPAML